MDNLIKFPRKDHTDETFESLLDQMVSSRALSQQDAIRLHTAHESTGETLRTLVLRLGLMSETELVTCLVDIYDAQPYSTDGRDIEHIPALNLPNDYLLDVQVLPLDVSETALSLGMVDITDFLVRKAIEIKTGLSVLPIPMTEDQFNIASSMLVTDEHSEVIDDGFLASLSQDDVHRLTDLASDAPVVHIVESLFSKAIQQGASDIHLTVIKDGLRVRNRIDGALREQSSVPRSHQTGVISRLKILAGLDIAEQRVPQDGRISSQIAGEQIDIRLSTMPQIDGEGAVLRLLRRSANYLSLPDLGLSPHVIDPLRSILQTSEGLFLVTGPTGSGKTTTLYAALREIARPELSVSTIEDPVENRLDGIAQIQINTNAGLGFATALRSLLRQDPDVVLVGEIRDGETAQIANRAALTGHLVLSTLHTDGAVSVIPRLLDLGVEDYLLASTLKGAMAQRLLPRLCPDCKEEKPINEQAHQQLKSLVGPDWQESFLETLSNSKGCFSCNHTGYRGRVLVTELLCMTNSMRHAIREKSDSIAIGKAARQEGFKPMMDDAFSRLMEGVVSLEDVIRSVPPASR